MSAGYQLIKQYLDGVHELFFAVMRKVTPALFQRPLNNTFNDCSMYLHSEPVTLNLFQGLPEMCGTQPSQFLKVNVDVSICLFNLEKCEAATPI